jgi:hypothetical protein
MSEANAKPTRIHVSLKYDIFIVILLKTQPRHRQHSLMVQPLANHSAQWRH